ncbi:MAG: NAD(+)/NADH kinase [Phycisphaerales bacterium]|nr:NAD(+)/NADH kinase [Phycisphaerales bacterium]
MRLFIVVNHDKPQVRAALDEMLPWIKKHADVIDIDGQTDKDLSTVDADVILVMGGDGTLLSAARRLQGRPIPLLGVNFGKLGFLSSFSVSDFQRHFDKLLTGELPMRARLMLEASVISADVTCRYTDPQDVAAQRRFTATALNDAVITAGSPFHMIEMNLSADGQTSVRFFGDGVIVATPSGSTAYNISAGGPIIQPGVDGFCITPICPHSLSFRPVVVSSQSTILITVLAANKGTTLFCDGQVTSKLQRGDTIVVRRDPHTVTLIENPDVRGFHTLAQKLHWAIGPRYNS